MPRGRELWESGPVEDFMGLKVHASAHALPRRASILAPLRGPKNDAFADRFGRRTLFFPRTREMWLSGAKMGENTQLRRRTNGLRATLLGWAMRLATATWHPRSSVPDGWHTLEDPAGKNLFPLLDAEIKSEEEPMVNEGPFVMHPSEHAAELQLPAGF